MAFNRASVTSQTKAEEIIGLLLLCIARRKQLRERAGTRRASLLTAEIFDVDANAPLAPEAEAAQPDPVRPPAQDASVNAQGRRRQSVQYDGGSSEGPTVPQTFSKPLSSDHPASEILLFFEARNFLSNRFEKYLSPLLPRGLWAVPFEFLYISKSLSANSEIGVRDSYSI